MKQFAFIFVAGILLSSASFAQTTPEQAEAALKAKQAARAAAAARPSNLTQGDVDALRAELAQLRAECTALKKEIADLKKAPKAAPLPPVPVQQNPERLKRYQDAIERRKAAIDDVKNRSFPTQFDRDKAMERETYYLQLLRTLAAINPPPWCEYITVDCPEEQLIGKTLAEAQKIIGATLHKIDKTTELEFWAADLGYKPIPGRKETQRVTLSVSIKTKEVVSQQFHSQSQIR